ncbi:equistatin-like [Pecten maximus]|uniref:equistatin-like n=1 Tax=Pecten maximus TaxID=6579 RepID=UPI001458A799|nr:equistatin-like [Pecten maximus]
MKVAMLALLLVIDIVFAAVAPQQTCRDELNAIEARLASQSNGAPRVGTLKPQCLDDGSYAPRQCLGSICRCVSPEGAKLTEEFTIGLAYKTNCECASDLHQYSLLQIVGKIFNCTPIGSYHPTQCTGSVCYCVDRQGQQVGQETVNIGSQNQLNC